MIYYKDDKEVSLLEFKNKLSLDVAATFGISDADNIEELTLMLMSHMTLSFKEVLMGGHKYQILVHPIVYVDRPLPYQVSTNYNPCLSCPKNGIPYWSITHPCTGCPHFKGFDNLGMAVSPMSTDTVTTTGKTDSGAAISINPNTGTVTLRGSTSSAKVPPPDDPCWTTTQYNPNAMGSKHIDLSQYDWYINHLNEGVLEETYKKNKKEKTK